MASLQELRDVRINKIQILKDAGMNPYPASVPRSMNLNEVQNQFTELESTGSQISLTGRVMAVRGAGAIMFVVLQENGTQFQAVLKKDDMDEAHMQLFKDAVDVGDFVSVTGPVFVTQKGQESLLVKTWEMATKSLLPLPDKHKGLQDVDERYRKRYLELIMDPEAYERFMIRTNTIRAVRRYLDNRGFMEIETPILQNQAGGAMAKTFDTHHNDYDMDMVLRIALELDHKIVMAAGYGAVYEIGKNFRNEGSDPTHIQEFTMVEWYHSHATLEDNLNWTEDMIRSIAAEVVGTTTFTVYDKNGDGVEVDMNESWPRMRFDVLLKENAGLDMVNASLEEVQTKAREWGMADDEISKTGRANLLDFIYKKSSRNNIVNPTFVTNYPSGLKPLAQQNDDGTAQVAQLIIGGAEITNQYAELVDPLAQRELLETQSAARGAGDEEAMQIDERFLTAMEHGMPPMTGFGMGIDRLVSILTNQKNLRDVIFFPMMRPKDRE